MARRAVGAATYEAPPNIALVKYWGVRDVALVLPNNSSLSVTLNRLRTRTRVRFDPALAHDVFALNGQPSTGRPLAAVARFLDLVRQQAGIDECAVVASSNNFPTSSGLASSASGFAALAGAATAAAGLRTTPRDLSRLARRGSGSACRSVYGGFVEWNAGRRSDGRDSYATPLYPPEHWPGLIDLVGLVRDAPVKSVRSAVAMQSTVESSPEYSRRLGEIPRRISGMKKAIRRRDSAGLFDLMIEECDSFRRVCETTRPRLDYLTSSSRKILAAVREANSEAGSTVAGYTHDAGAHVHVFTTADAPARLRRRLRSVPGVARWLTVGPGPGGKLLPNA